MPLTLEIDIIRDINSSSCRQPAHISISIHGAHAVLVRHLHRPTTMSVLSGTPLVNSVKEASDDPRTTVSVARQQVAAATTNGWGFVTGGSSSRSTGSVYRGVSWQPRVH